MPLRPEDKQALDRYFKPSHGKMPQTAQAARLSKRRHIRGLVFGLQDGILSALGTLAGLDAAVGSQWATLVAAYECTVMGALSMGVGEFLGTRAETQVVKSVVEQEEEAFENNPEAEFMEQVEFLKEKGFTEDEAHMITRRLTQNPEVWLAENLKDEYEVNPADAKDDIAIKNGTVMGLAFGLGSFLPTIAFQLYTPNPPLAALVISIICLATVGWISGVVSSSTPWRRAIELVAVGSVLFAATWFGGIEVRKLWGQQ